MQPIILVTALVLFVVYAGLILYYRQSWLSIPDFTSPEGTNPQTKISVIIPARNEEKNIGACITSILANNYAAAFFEIIVVDDYSNDDTAEIVRSFSAQNVQLISLKEHISNNINSYKKKAIEVAIQNAKGELIVTTDADCLVPKNWLQTIVGFYEKKDAMFIAAPVVINSKNSFIEIFQALDFMTLQGITGAGVYKKMHAMCNGANLAYKKEAFYEVNGFTGIDSIASGDDMLLMYKIYKRYPDKIFFLKSKDAIVQTAAVKTIGQFFNQRIRWASKADKYEDKSLLPVLAVVYFFNLLLLLVPMLCLFTNPQYLISNIQYSMFEAWVMLLILKIIIELLFLYPVANFFGKQKLLWLFPLMQPFHILYTVIAGFLGKFGTYKWKERKVK